MNANNIRNNYFNRKRIILFSFLSILIMVIIILFSKFILDIDFSWLALAIKQSFLNNGNKFTLWLFLLLLYPLISVWYRIKSYKIKLKEDNIHVKWYDWTAFGFIGFFINAITPFAIGCEPFNLYWLKMQGVSLKRATVIVSSVFIFYPFVQVIITWPSFFILSASYASNVSNHEWIVCYWLSFLGLFFDLANFLFFLILSYSRRMHVLINIILNWIRKKMGMSFKTKEEINDEFKIKANFKNAFINELKKWKQTLFLLFSNVLCNIAYYASVIIAFQMMYNNINTNWFMVFNYVNVSVTANNFIPIPGAEGTLQKLLNVFICSGLNIKINEIVVPNDDANKLIANAIFIWRIFSWYILSGLGFFMIPIVIYNSIRFGYNLSAKSYLDIIKKYKNDRKLPKIAILINEGNSYKIIEYLKLQSYKNFVIIINGDCKNLTTKTNIISAKIKNNNDLIKLIDQHNIDNFIWLGNDDEISNNYIETAMYFSQYDQDLIISAYDYHLKKYLINVFINCWFKKTKNKNKFISKNFINWYGIIVDSNFFKKNIYEYKLHNYDINDQQLLYLMYLNSNKIRFNIRNYRSSNIPTKNKIADNELCNLVIEQINKIDENDKAKILHKYQKLIAR